jgi:hypothetical protein
MTLPPKSLSLTNHLPHQKSLLSQGKGIYSMRSVALTADIILYPHGGL